MPHGVASMRPSETTDGNPREVAQRAVERGASMRPSETTDGNPGWKR